MSSQVTEEGVESIERAAEALLREHPDALVCGLAFDGLMVPIPRSVKLWGQAAIEGRAVTDVVVAEDRTTVIDLWQQVKQEGVAEGKVRLLSKPSHWMTLHFLDLRNAYGVLLCILLPSGESAAEESDEADELPPAAPRFSTIMEDEAGVVLGCDESFTQMFGYTAEELIGKSVLDQIHPDDTARVVEGWVAMLSTRRVQQTRLRRRRKDGSWMWVDTTLHNMLNQPDRNHVLVEIIDVSAEMAAQEALQEQGVLLRRLIESMPDGLLQLDTERNVVYHNARLLEILHGACEAACAEAELTGASGVEASDAPALSAGRLLSTLTEEGMAAFDAALGQVFERGIDREVEVDIALPSGGWRRALMSIRVLLRASGEVSGAIASVLDITDSARARHELEVRATFDALTGSYNRQSILSALRLELEREDPTKTAVIYVDLDNFKAVNDTLGHAAGDELLAIVAERLKVASRAEDEIGRLGGDEFLVLLRSLPEADVAMSVAHRISASLRTGVQLSQGHIEPCASIGVAHADGEATSAEQLVERADAAMYRSKQQKQGLPVLATRTARPTASSSG